MYIGLYSAASGMLTSQRALNVNGNNMANAQTTGFKKDLLVKSTLGENTAIYSDGTDVGEISYGSAANEVYTTYTQGFIEPTERSLDMAIQGDGFFSIMRDDGLAMISRNGQFKLDSDGFLITGDGSFVLGENGPLLLGSADFTVTDDGQIYRDGAYMDTLSIICPSDSRALIKIKDGLYEYPEGQILPFEGKIKQAALERSNVDIITEMTEMMKSSRSFQSCSRMVRMMDEVLRRSVNDIGKLY